MKTTLLIILSLLSFSASYAGNLQAFKKLAQSEYGPQTFEEQLIGFIKKRHAFRQLEYEAAEEAGAIAAGVTSALRGLETMIKEKKKAGLRYSASAGDWVER